MLKFIFYTIIIGLFIVMFDEAIADTTIMITDAATTIASALSVILSILLIPFRSMLSFYYLKMALYIGLLIFSLSYIFKYITGHHLTTEEDVEEEVVEANFLDKKPNLILPMPSRTKDLYSSKQSYDPWHNLKVINAKKENQLYESSLRKAKKVKNYEKESMDNIQKQLDEFRKQVRERRKRK